MADAPQRMDSAPKDGTRFLAWFQKLKLDEDDIATNEVIGGAWFVVSFSGGSWDYPTDLEAAGAYFFDDWCWAEDPVLWRDLPPEPVAADYTPGVEGRIITGEQDDTAATIPGSAGAASGQPGCARVRDAASDGGRHGAGRRDAGSGEHAGGSPLQGNGRGGACAREAAQDPEVLKLLPRIDAAIERITTGRAPMRVSAEDTDPDLVLADCKRLLRSAYGVVASGDQTLRDHTPSPSSLEGKG